MVTGGETIHGINEKSGAHVELQRNNDKYNSNPAEKLFIIRAGSKQQAQHAIQLICEKAGLVSTYKDINYIE